MTNVPFKKESIYEKSAYEKRTLDKCYRSIYIPVCRTPNLNAYLFISLLFYVASK